MYNIANIGHKVNLISAGVYCLFSSINIYLTIKQVKDKRNKIRKINDEIKKQSVQYETITIKIATRSAN